MKPEEADAVFAGLILVGLWFFVWPQGEHMGDDSIWKQVRCQRCGALPIENEKALDYCPVCYSVTFGPFAPDYSKLTPHDVRFLEMISRGPTAWVRKEQ